MRKVMFGIVLPLACVVLTFWTRLRWQTDLRPPQLSWWVWAISLTLTGALLGFGVRAYWFDGGHRQDSKGRKEN